MDSDSGKKRSSATGRDDGLFRGRADGNRGAAGGNLSRWCSRSPYTYFHLQDWLDGCVGAGNYTGTLERESYRLRLVLELCVKEKREFLQKHLRKIIPANLVLQVNLNVNTHGKLHRIRHGEMKEKGLTYGGIPFEILPEEEGNSAVSGKKLLQRMRGCATIQK